MSNQNNRTNSGFTNFERLGLVITLGVIGIIIFSVIYLATAQKDTLIKNFRFLGSSSSSSNTESNFNQETKNLVESCISSESIKNFVPDQYYIDKLKDNGNKAEVMTQNIYKLSQRIQEDDKLEIAQQDKNLENDYYSSWLGYLKVDSYNRDRVEVNKLMETKIDEAKTMSYKTFVTRYYCGQLQAYKILNDQNRYSYKYGYLEFKKTQLNNLQGLNDDDFEKRVYTQARNDYGSEINFRKAYDQYIKIVNI